MNKLCTKCKTIKLLEEFSKNSSTKDGYQGWCRNCNATACQRYYDKNTERHKQYIKRNRQLVTKTGTSLSFQEKILKRQSSSKEANKRTTDLCREQLGEHLSTARSRLVKSLLFKLLQESGQAVCFKCSLPIKIIDELSIEHIIPWLHEINAKELFFDLENVTFSHLKCNRPNRPRSFRQAEKFPEGFKRCSRCKNILILNEFYDRKSSFTGKSSQCKSCHNEIIGNKRRQSRLAPRINIPQ